MLYHQNIACPQEKLTELMGTGGYSQEVYTYSFEDNGNTVVIFAPSENSAIDTIVKNY